MNLANVKFRRAVARSLRPLLRTGIIGSARLIRWTGADSDVVWAGTPRGKVKLRWNAGVVELDRSERYERLAWFQSRYHELPLLLLMNRLLRRGDTFIDVGANLGLVSLHAARIVGASGRVIALEPNPKVCERLQSHVNASRAAVVIDARALGDEPGELTLTVIGANTGSGTLGAIPEHLRPSIRGTYRVPVVVGDELSAHWFGAPVTARMLLKIDAEGSETRVLRGLRNTLELHRPIIVTEINPFALRMNGSGPRVLTDFMVSLGYEGFELEARRSGLLQSQPTLGPMRPPRKPGLRDVVWTHPDGPWRNEIERLLVSGARITVPMRATTGPTSSSPSPTPAPSAPSR